MCVITVLSVFVGFESLEEGCDFYFFNVSDLVRILMFYSLYAGFLLGKYLVFFFV